MRVAERGPEGRRRDRHRQHPHRLRSVMNPSLGSPPVSEQLLTILGSACCSCSPLLLAGAPGSVGRPDPPQSVPSRPRRPATAAPAPAARQAACSRTQTPGPFGRIRRPHHRRAGVTAGRSFPLGDELTIGGRPAARSRSTAPMVSQIHGRVFTRDGQYLVEDLGSTNGTYLSGLVARPMVIRPGDRLRSVARSWKWDDVTSFGAGRPRTR